MDIIGATATRGGAALPPHLSAAGKGNVQGPFLTARDGCAIETMERQIVVLEIHEADISGDMTNGSTRL